MKLRRGNGNNPPPTHTLNVLHESKERKREKSLRSTFGEFAFNFWWKEKWNDKHGRRAAIIAAVLNDCHRLVRQPDFQVTGKTWKQKDPAFRESTPKVDVLAVQLPGPSATHHLPANATQCSAHACCREADGVETHRPRPRRWPRTALHQLWGACRFTVSPSPAYVGWGVCRFSPCPPLQHTSAGLSVSSPRVCVSTCLLLLLGTCPVSHPAFLPCALDSWVKSAHHQATRGLAHPASILLPSCRVLARDTPSKLQFSHPPLWASGVHRTWFCGAAMFQLAYTMTKWMAAFSW